MLLLPRRLRRPLASSPIAVGRAASMCGALLALSLAAAPGFAQTEPTASGVSPAKHRDADKPKSPKPQAAHPKPQPPPAAAQKPATQIVAPVLAAPRAPHEESSAKAPRGSASPLDTSAPPPRLPAASREKMHACAVEWAQFKQNARGPLPLWRDFATACLTR